MPHSLIVARMNRVDEDAVATAFAESDATELPSLIGVRRRTLFTFHDLYFHLIEADDDIGHRLPALRDHPRWREINARLDRYIRPYDPQTWRSPADAMARSFYTWAS